MAGIFYLFSGQQANSDNNKENRETKGEGKEKKTMGLIEGQNRPVTDEQTEEIGEMTTLSK